MSIQSEINRIAGNVSDALDAISEKGVVVPQDANSDDLAQLIGSIQNGTQADWDETDTTALSYIKNKPTIPSKVSDLTNDSGFLTSADVQEITSAQITSIISTIDTTGGWTRANGVNF